MEVILLERVEKLGGIGDVVTVKNGFARNYPPAEQEGASRQRSQPEGLRSQSREDRGRQCRSPQRCGEGCEGRRRQDGQADPSGVEHRPALRFSSARDIVEALEVEGAKVAKTRSFSIVRSRNRRS